MRTRRRHRRRKRDQTDKTAASVTPSRIYTLHELECRRRWGRKQGIGEWVHERMSERVSEEKSVLLRQVCFKGTNDERRRSDFDCGIMMSIGRDRQTPIWQGVQSE